MPCDWSNSITAPTISPPAGQSMATLRLVAKSVSLLALSLGVEAARP